MARELPPWLTKSTVVPGAFFDTPPSRPGPGNGRRDGSSNLNSVDGRTRKAKEQKAGQEQDEIMEMLLRYEVNHSASMQGALEPEPDEIAGGGDAMDEDEEGARRIQLTDLPTMLVGGRAYRLDEINQPFFDVMTGKELQEYKAVCRHVYQRHFE